MPLLFTLLLVEYESGRSQLTLSIQSCMNTYILEGQRVAKRRVKVRQGCVLEMLSSPHWTDRNILLLAAHMEYIFAQDNFPFLLDYSIRNICFVI